MFYGKFRLYFFQQIFSKTPIRNIQGKDFHVPLPMPQFSHMGLSVMNFFAKDKTWRYVPLVAHNSITHICNFMDLRSLLELTTAYAKKNSRNMKNKLKLLNRLCNLVETPSSLDWGVSSRACYQQQIKRTQLWVPSILQILIAALLACMVLWVKAHTF